MKKTILAAMMAGSILLAGCGGDDTAYKDGTYEGRSSVYHTDEGSDEGNGYGVVTITVTGGKIANCVYKTYEEDGTEKGEDYGKEDGRIANKDFYNKAQKANAACAEYANMLVQNGQLKGIDAISGATINYNEFVEAVNDALSQAKE
ncbi:MAG: FMN-binding protein [Lachnospiraceae bacterium]|nr:FMN-binding protein [Lachnospiraceae bacterium]